MASVGSERCASQTSNGPGIAPAGAPPLAERLRSLGVAGGHVAEHQVGVPRHLLRGARERVRRAEVERPLEQRPSRGVVHHVVTPSAARAARS
jgi:hypothetical protein